MVINICLTADNNYIKPLAYTLISILENADKNDILNIFIFTNNISDTNKNKILNISKNKNYRIQFINIDTKIFAQFPKYKISKHITAIGYSRLLIAELLKDIDKIIYLDCDTIVLTDLKDLFITDIEDYYIAAAEDAGHQFNIKKYSKFYEIFNIYINSGVLLINLKLWRKDNLLQKSFNCIETNKENFMLGDQDVINLTCKDKIKIIDFSYNLQTSALNIKNFLSPRVKNILKTSLKNPKIIHYSTHMKPWNAHTHLKKFFFKIEEHSPLETGNNLQLKIKHLKFFIIYLLKNIFSFLRFLISPIMKGYRKDGYIKIRIFNFFEFNLTKTKNN